MKRKYKSGSIWTFWRWTDDVGYITRLHLIKTPWFAVCVHWLHHPDIEPWRHDHPVTFLSFILHGWYKELRDVEHALQEVTRTWYNFIKCTDRHTITEVAPYTMTLCFMGPVVRKWGFNTDKGWIYYKDYYKEKELRKIS